MYQKIITFLMLLCICSIQIKAQDKNFTEEEVTFRNAENTFSGTLAIPKKTGKFPALILISGSGPQTRDSDIYGFKTFKTMSDYFVNLGIAVLRYDDRGTGKTTGLSIKESTIEDFADDVVQAFQYLLTRKEIDASKIGLLGHSEGGIVAPLAFQKEPKIAFTILMAGPAVSGGDIVLAQTEAMLQAMGSSKENIEKQLAQTRKTQEIITSGGDWEAYEKEIVQVIINEIDKLPTEQRQYITDPQAYAEATAKQQIAVVKTKWYQNFIKYNPKSSLEKLTCPTLALFGDLDSQVLTNQNEPALRRALQEAENRDFTVKNFSKANHLFQEAKTGSVNEYATLDKKFVNGFLEYIASWIQKRFAITDTDNNTDKEEKPITGKVSYYNDKYQGKKTASGELYDKNKLTVASHSNFAFGTVLEVTNTSNGKKVMVKVNDRLGKSNPRILDLSRAAAQAIDMIDAGTATVIVKVKGLANNNNKEEKPITGKVSYYNDKYQGKKTASGELYDKNKLTVASHSNFAFGTVLEVTNTSNGKKVMVKVNDRLGKSNPRILDLSRAAAQAIDMIDAGTATVKVRVLKK